MAIKSPAAPVLVIGAGLSGLAAGRILANHGVPTIVFEESSPELGESFAMGLRDWCYQPLLEALGGVSLKSMIKAVAPDRHVGGSGLVDFCMRDNATGNILVTTPDDKRPVVTRANRNAVRAWLADCGDDDLDVRYHHKLATVSGTLGNMTAVFENGAQYNGCLIIAADGVDSAVRTQLLPDLVPQILPAVIYNGRFQLSRQEFDQHIKPRTNGSNVLSGIGDGFNTNITVCNMTDAKVNLDWSYSRRARGDTDALFDNSEGAKTRGVTGTIPEALVEELSSYQLADPWGRYVNAEAIKQHSVFQWVSRCVFVPTEEAKKNGQQGVVFVGDAWHTMPVFSGEGGNHGVLDSVELAMAIVEKDSLEQAISAYYDGARHRVEEAVKRSKTRFFWLHRPMAEWQEVSEKRKMAEERVAKAGTVTA